MGRSSVRYLWWWGWSSFRECVSARLVWLGERAVVVALPPHHPRRATRGFTGCVGADGAIGQAGAVIFGRRGWAAPRPLQRGSAEGREVVRGGREQRAAAHARGEASVGAVATAPASPHAPPQTHTHTHTALLRVCCPLFFPLLCVAFLPPPSQNIALATAKPQM